MTDSIINCLWVVAHEPIELFLKGARTFKSLIEKESNGRIQIQIMTRTEFQNTFNNGKDDVFYRHLKDGKFQMGQFPTTALGSRNKDFYVFDMPFLFRDHEHAKSVLDGEIGERMLESLAEQSAVR